jgi:hypothetical protein
MATAADLPILSSYIYYHDSHPHPTHCRLACSMRQRHSLPSPPLPLSSSSHSNSLAPPPTFLLCTDSASCTLALPEEGQPTT